VIKKPVQRQALESIFIPAEPVAAVSNLGTRREALRRAAAHS
jgi:hypothetical protein